MTANEWDPALSLGENGSQKPGYFLNPDKTRSIYSGHHRQIAEEMLRLKGFGFRLEKEVIKPSQKVLGGEWSDLEREPNEPAK
jgi:hypothetical protein